MSDHFTRCRRPPSIAHALQQSSSRSVDDTLNEIDSLVKSLNAYWYGKCAQPKESFGLNKNPSTAFCLMYMLFRQKPKRRHIDRMLGHDNPYMRCVALLYLR